MSARGEKMLYQALWQGNRQRRGERIIEGAREAVLEGETVFHGL